MPADPFAKLGAFLTSNEASALASQIEAGQLMTRAIRSIHPSRRDEAKRLLAATNVGDGEAEISVALLRAIAGARTIEREVTPIWTMPGNDAGSGRLTNEFHHLVRAARMSVTCATYNFADTSQMWSALQQASEQSGVAVTVYVDSAVADAAEVKQRLSRATVYRSATLDNGHRVVSHAKFVVIDHEVLLVTSANFSYNAENRNIEFGLFVRDPNLCENVEATMASKHGTLYELM